MLISKHDYVIVWCFESGSWQFDQSATIDAHVAVGGVTKTFDPFWMRLTCADLRLLRNCIPYLFRVFVSSFCFVHSWACISFLLVRSKHSSSNWFSTLNTAFDMGTGVRFWCIRAAGYISKWATGSGLFSFLISFSFLIARRYSSFVSLFIWLALFFIDESARIAQHSQP